MQWYYNPDYSPGCPVIVRKTIPKETRRLIPNNVEDNDVMWVTSSSGFHLTTVREKTVGKEHQPQSCNVVDKAYYLYVLHFLLTGIGGPCLWGEEQIVGKERGRWCEGMPHKYRGHTYGQRIPHYGGVPLVVISGRYTAAMRRLVV